MGDQPDVRVAPHGTLVRSRVEIERKTDIWSPFFRYLKHVDRFFNSYISCFVTPSNVKFLLLHQPVQPSSAGSSSVASRSSTSIAANPTSPQTEEAVKSFFTEIYENWVKACMSPFYRVNMEVTSPVFRQRVAAAGRKYL